ncbi:hypothetical protein ACHAW6_005126 [Cyclotella cf. meneghiniana]
MSEESSNADAYPPPPPRRSIDPSSLHLNTTPWLTPGRAFLFSSLPLGIGTYIGYRRALSQSASEESMTVSSSKHLSSGRGNSILPPQITRPLENARKVNHIHKVDAPLLAVRALAVGSLLSVSATSLLVSCVFYASDAHSVDDLISKWRRWAPLKLREVERMLGVCADRRETMEYERAVRGMSEEEELEYVRQKYGEELRWDDEGQDDSRSRR